MTELDSNTFPEAIRSEQPSVVDFWASWCMPCKIFAPVLEEISSEMDGKADFYKVNVDDFNDLAAQYEVTHIPTVIIFKQGEVAERFVGMLGKDEVKQAVERQL